MTVGIVTFAAHMNLPHAGSTRIRVTWPLRHWPEAELFRVGRHYDAVIFQKAYWLGYAARFRGMKILDLCDPDFFEQRAQCIAMMNRCDAITCSSTALTKHVSTLTRTPVRTIPDRLDFDAIGDPGGDRHGDRHGGDRKKIHRGPARTAAWFGYAQNYPMLDRAIDGLVRLGIPRLLVIAERDKPYQLPPRARGRTEIIQRTWSEATIYDDLLEADVVVNFRGRTGRWRFKSNNKSVLAWSLGLPVAHDHHELARLMSEEARTEEAGRRSAEVRAAYDVRQSVADYRSLLGDIARWRAGSPAMAGVEEQS